MAACVGRRKPRKSLERHAVLKPLTTIKSKTICEHKSISGRIKARKLEIIIAYDTNKWQIVIKSKTREISLTQNVQFTPPPTPPSNVEQVSKELCCLVLWAPPKVRCIFRISRELQQNDDVFHAFTRDKKSFIELSCCCSCCACCTSAEFKMSSFPLL